MAIYWVQGLRRQSAGVLRRAWRRLTRKRGADTDWRRVLWLRLVGRQYEIPIGEKTRRAEQGLGLPNCSYFYVARCEPDMGRAPVAFTPPASAGDAKVTPFDTGGLFHRLLHVEPHLSTLLGKKRLLAGNSFSLGQYVEKFQAWGRAAFDCCASYVEGKAPSRSAVDGVRCGLNDDPRHWTWEARVPFEHFPEGDIAPTIAFLSGMDHNRFMDWLVGFDGMDVTEWRCVRDILPVVKETEDFPEHRPMTEWLKGQEPW